MRFSIKIRTLGTLMVTYVLVAGLSAHAADTRSTELKSESCSRPKTNIVYRHEKDYEDACQALTRAEDFFHTYGHNVDAPVTLVFQDKVMTQISEDKEIQVYGRYDVESNTAYLTSYHSDFVKAPDRMDFGLNLSPEGALKRELHLARVTQEVAHFYIQDNVQENGTESLNIALRKFVAYVVQLTTMDPDLLNQILDKNAGIQFDSVDSINPILHNDDPQKFGVMSYRFFHSDRGGNKLLTKIFRGKIEVKEEARK